MPECHLFSIHCSLTEENEDTIEYKQKLIANLKTAWREVKQFNDRIKQERETEALKHRQQHQFKQGDLVWLYTKHRKKGLSKKLSHLWHGPYRIAFLSSPVNVKLATLQGKELGQTIHVSRLKKCENELELPTEDLDVNDEFDWELEYEKSKKAEEIKDSEKENVTGKKRKERNEEVQQQGSKEARENENKDSEEDDDIFRVKEIRGIRRGKNGVQYLVSWEGYSRNHDSWEPKENIFDEESLDTFHLKNKTLCHCGFRAFSINGLKKHQRVHAQAD